MNRTLDTEQFEAISVADVMQHPDFDPKLAGLIHQIDINAANLSLGQISGLLGLDARSVALGLANSLILAEVERIKELHHARERGLN